VTIQKAARPEDFFNEIGAIEPSIVTAPGSALAI